MSLINQMLIDLEQRGADSTVAKKIIANQVSVATAPYAGKYNSLKTGVPYLKLSGLMVLIVGGAYLWTQSSLAQSHNNEIAKPAVIQMNLISDTKSASQISAPKQEVTNSSQTSTQSTRLFETTLKFTPLEAKVEQNSVNQKFMLANYVPSKVEGKTLDYTNPTTLAKPAVTAESTNNTTIDQATNAQERTLVALKVPVTNDGIAISKQIRPEQKSANLYRQALANIQQGRVAEAQEALSQALEANPANQEARQTLAGLLLDSKHNDEAKTIIAAGLAIAPEQSNFRMVLARLQVETGDRTAALNTLEQGQVYAKNNADYQSFYATLLQRADRHEDAINHYNTSLALNSSSASSLIGLGISLEATGKLMSARDAFTRAQNLTTLSPELAQFADQRLKQINQHLQNTTLK